jgi:hypothetical protein
MADPVRKVISLPSKGDGNEGEDVTYCPGRDDPHVTKWRGVEFKANVPMRVTNAEMIDAARLNRFFRVGNETNINTPHAPPTTAMAYRGWVLDWVKEVETIDQLVTHWAADRALRSSCEVGQDDISFLGTLIEPKLKQFRMAAGLSDAQVADIWVKHGILELPWRA